jgi:iron complex outermembrane recepter protein
MKTLLSAVVAATLALTVAAAQADGMPSERKVPLVIESKTLAEALDQWAQQTGFQILVPNWELAKKISAPRLQGKYGARDALDRLLEGTSLMGVWTSDKAVTIREKEMPNVRQGAPSRGPSVQKFIGDGAEGGEASSAPSAGRSSYDAKAAASAQQSDEFEEVVVTGTHIHGVAPDSSPITTYRRETIEQSGAATIEQFAAKMPENFSSIRPASFAYGNSTSGFSQSRGNDYSGASFNLYGLGPGATLTLLDGHRISAGGKDGGFTDISTLPLSAVDRIEVLTDGASSIYGSDAIAGVVNIVPRRGFDGAETSVRYGDTTRGGAAHWSASQVLGTSWSRGSGLLVLEHHDENALRSTSRSFIPDQGMTVDITPSQERNSALLSGEQALADETTLKFDAFFGDRDFEFLRNIAGLFPTNNVGEVRNYGAAAEVEQQLPGAWRAEVGGSYSTTDQTLTTTALLLPDPLTIDNPALTKLWEANLKADGPLFEIGGGFSRAAVGVSFREESLQAEQQFAGRLSRTVKSAFTEVFVPIISPSAERDARLEISASGRYDEYSDVGSTFNPKVGLLWSPLRALKLRGTYGRSFRPPLQSQLAPIPAYYTWLVANANSPSGFTDTLISESQGISELDPEKARTFTVGFNLSPASIPGFSVSGTYFDTHFRGRIAPPPVVGSIFAGADIFSQSQLAPFVSAPPSSQELQAIFASSGFFGDFAGGGTDGVEAVFDNELANISSTSQQGVQFLLGYDTNAEWGSVNTSIGGTYLLANDYRTVKGAPAVELLDVIGEPADLRVFATFAFRRGPIMSSLMVNYTDQYLNPIFQPADRISSWTTADVSLAYDFGVGGRVSALNGFEVILSVQNVFDRAPPTVKVPSDPGSTFSNVGFDATNASPLGRTIGLQLRKRWLGH